MSSGDPRGLSGVADRRLAVRIHYSMSADKQYHDSVFAQGGPLGSQEPVLVATVVPESAPAASSPPRVLRRRVWLPLGLFLATCLSTLYVGSDYSFWFTADGLKYALCVMTILVCHEAGHFIQAWRYGVYASFPFFIPMPFSPIGTFGAVIGMDSRVGDRKELFDIGITGPVAGLIPTLIFLVIGLQHSTAVAPANVANNEIVVGSPLLLSLLTHWLVPAAPGAQLIEFSPMAFAGWVGLLITSLNLLPIGQLDGGHILYGLLRRQARPVSSFLLVAAAVAVIAFGYYQWFVMLFLLTLMGPHPPTANDNVPLGVWRIALGWLMLAFFFLGFTPQPFRF